MLKHSPRRLIPVGALVAFWHVLGFLGSAPGEPPNSTIPLNEVPASDARKGASPQAIALPDEAPAPVTEQSYVGTNQCFACHRPQTNTWSETNHAHAFTNLPEKYRNDSCLKCHVTGYGRPGGYVAATDKDLLMVGCESCHGPGAQHIDAAQRFIMATPDEEEEIEKQMRDTIVKTPTDSVCIGCHITQAHQAHPSYEGQLSRQAPSDPVDQCSPMMPIASRRTAAPALSSSRSSPYNIKTCGGCHYDEYKQWRTEKHSDLSAMLSVTYRNDRNCQQCHPHAGAAAISLSSESDQHQHWIGVACESCHGPGLEHVNFNKRFILAPPLGPRLEQAARHSIRKGKSDTTCIKCHVGESHKEHPDFDKTKSVMNSRVGAVRR